MALWFRRLRARIRYRRFDDDLRREMEVHEAMAESDLRAAGLSADDARTRAHLNLGNATLARESSREVWIAPWLESLWQDVRYAARGLVHRPAFSLAAFAALVVGIGLNTCLFTMANALLLKPWPVPDVDRVASVFSQEWSQQYGHTVGPFNRGQYLFLKEHAHTIDLATMGTSVVRLESDPAGKSSLARMVSDTYFDVLQIPMALGRGFRPGENDVVHPSAVVVLSHRIWEQRYGASASIVGQTIRLGGGSPESGSPDVPFIVVGVAAPGATDDPMRGSPAVWLPEAVTQLVQYSRDTPDQRAKARQGAIERWSDMSVDMAGRLRGLATRAESQAELTTLGRQLGAGKDTSARGILVTGTSGVENPRVGDALRVLSLLFAGLLLILLLACANVGNLQLARALARRREITIRLGLGASRARVVRQLLTESLVLSIGASAASVVVAAFLPRVILRQLIHEAGPDVRNLAPDVRVLVVALLLGVMTCLLSGLLPALRATRTIASGRYAIEGGRSRLRSALLGLQVAVSVVLLIGAALLARGISHAAAIDQLGFDIRTPIMVSIDLPPKAYDAARVKAFGKTVADTAQQAGIIGMGTAQIAPFGGFMETGVRRPEEAETSVVYTRLNIVSPGYFEILKIPIAAGRLFSADAPDADVVVNQTLARRLWPGEATVIGRPFLTGATTRRVVGVVRDAHLDDASRIEPSVFENGGDGRAFSHFFVDDQAVVAKLRTIVTTIEPRATVTIKPLADNLHDELQGSIFGASLAAAMGALALVLAGVGTFGVFSYVVVERTREIGIRMAIGARGSDVMGLVLGGMSWSLGIGLGAGLLASIGTGVLLRPYLFGLSPRDPAAYGVVALVLGLSAAAATCLPVWRAIHVNPAITLRHE